ncbi:MAG: aldo/keto reductase, partial [Actinobacteria bacterium]|nr:aldo/keto reductase [Actinomycetota bacterium]
MIQLGSTDLNVHPLCLGGNVFGWTADEASSFEVLDAYAAAGGNFIDTADAYSHWVPGNKGGESETIIGNWMASRGNRDS